mmetsp:Transcript_99067/g.251521  ORF Transcript_99067/g.251521 Transcript_99067/m.251521 type:complete len:225 (+) Transcript_99067:1288-1962(+)
MLMEGIQSDHCHTSLQRQQVRTVVRAALREDAQASAFPQAAIDLIKHLALVHLGVDLVLHTALAPRGGRLEDRVRVRGDGLHFVRVLLPHDLHLVPGPQLFDEGGAFSPQAGCAVEREAPGAREGDVLRSGHRNAVEGLRQKSDQGSIKGLLRNHEGHLPVTIRQQNNAINKLVVVVASEDDRASFGQVLQADNLDGAEKHVVEGTSEESPHTIVQHAFLLVHH